MEQAPTLKFERNVTPEPKASSARNHNHIGKSAVLTTALNSAKECEDQEAHH